MRMHTHTVVHNLILFFPFAHLVWEAAWRRHPRVGALFSTSRPIIMLISHVRRVSGVVLLMVHLSNVLMSSISFVTMSEMISTASCSTQDITAERPCLSSNTRSRSLMSFLDRFARNPAWCFMNSGLSNCWISRRRSRIDIWLSWRIFNTILIHSSQLHCEPNADPSSANSIVLSTYKFSIAG